MRTLLIAVIGGLLLSVAGFAQEVPQAPAKPPPPPKPASVKVEDLPAPIQNAAKALFPEGKVDSAYMLTSGEGQKSYIVYIMQEAIRNDLSANEAGVISLIRTYYNATTLPKEIADAVAAIVPEAAIKSGLRLAKPVAKEDGTFDPPTWQYSVAVAKEDATAWVAVDAAGKLLRPVTWIPKPAPKTPVETPKAQPEAGAETK